MARMHELTRLPGRKISRAAAFFRWLCLVSLLYLPPALSAQLATGSIVVLESSGDYMAIAADSKSVSIKGTSLHRCKLVALDDGLVYAATGYTSNFGGPKFGNRQPWDASDIARQNYHLLAKSSRHELILKLAEAYGASIAAKLNSDVTTHPEEGWPWSLTTALFAGFDEKHQRVVVEVTVHQGIGAGQKVGYSTKVFPGTDQRYAEVVGETSIAQEYAAGSTPRSQAWREGMADRTAGFSLKELLISDVENVTELTSKFVPTLVGGPVDSILLSRKVGEAGVTWVHRKLECSATPAAP